MTNEQLITALMQYPLDAEVTLMAEFKGGGIRAAFLVGNSPYSVLVSVPTWSSPHDNQVRG